jgi:hypothetical protein
MALVHKVRVINVSPPGDIDCEHKSPHGVARSYTAENAELQYPPLDGYESYESWASGAGELRTSHESSSFRTQAGGEDDRFSDDSISQLPSTGDSGVEESKSFGRDNATEGDGSHRSADVEGGNKS